MSTTNHGHGDEPVLGIANVSMRGPDASVERPGGVLPYRDGPTIG